MWSRGPGRQLPAWRRGLPWAVAVAGFGAASASIAALWPSWRSVPTPAETRLEITTPPTDDPTSFAISPDGRQLVFVATGTGGQSQLWLRSLDRTTPQALAGTEGASAPFWSPDSRSLGFFTGTTLKRLDIGAGLPQTLVSSPNVARGGSWSVAGVILVGRNVGPLLSVPVTGGAAVDATKLAPEQTSHRWPYFLPGGRQFLFYTRGTSDGLYLGSLDSPDTKRIGTADAGAQFMPPDWRLFVRQSTLLAQPLDLARGEPTGKSVSIADQVAVMRLFGAGAFSVSTAGTITYRAGRAGESQLTWFDRSGKVLGTIGSPDANNLSQPTLSPDGRRVAVYRTMQGNTDLWLFDAGRETKLTFDAGAEMFPVWSPDGSRIAFRKELKGQFSLNRKSSLGASAEELLLTSPGNIVSPMAWSPDGRFLLYSQRDPVTGQGLWILPVDGKQQPFVFVDSKFEERTPQFSPDGQWVAFVSDESGRAEIYLRAFRGSSGQVPVSTAGGIEPRWRKDGKELYYIAPDGSLMAVPIVTTGPAPDIGAPVALFLPRIRYGGTMNPGVLWEYDVAPDGRFLINVIPPDSVAAPITVIQHWQAGSRSEP